jgi:hypothetical protein
MVCQCFWGGSSTHLGMLLLTHCSSLERDSRLVSRVRNFEVESCHTEGHMSSCCATLYRVSFNNNEVSAGRAMLVLPTVSSGRIVRRQHTEYAATASPQCKPCHWCQSAHESCFLGMEREAVWRAWRWCCDRLLRSPRHAAAGLGGQGEGTTTPHLWHLRDPIKGAGEERHLL